MATNETIGVRPVHLKSARGIGEAFGVKRDTVAEWARLGAPVIIIGGRYQADYHTLWDWLLKNSRKTQGGHVDAPVRAEELRDMTEIPATRFCDFTGFAGISDRVP